VRLALTRGIHYNQPILERPEKAKHASLAASPDLVKKMIRSKKIGKHPEESACRFTKNRQVLGGVQPAAGPGRSANENLINRDGANCENFEERNPASSIDNDEPTCFSVTHLRFHGGYFRFSLQ
jgi:hypothetical protein